ncbi:hypothetical protein DFP72DRAFT_856051 [Ephemerocybe angulata]|uniref:Uncharacterized protein n=1 Tax=Ephemerocybe angulata TaxID=980116 RepID=A0A8H6LYG5_9AGAR|nr:hypothetical protein DFP72DRAFT_856051 [Tulosesus angulatus]
MQPENDYSPSNSDPKAIGQVNFFGGHAPLRGMSPFSSGLARRGHLERSASASSGGSSDTQVDDDEEYDSNPYFTISRDETPEAAMIVRINNSTKKTAAIITHPTEVVELDPRRFDAYKQVYEAGRLAELPSSEEHIKEYEEPEPPGTATMDVCFVLNVIIVYHQSKRAHARSPTSDGTAADLNNAKKSMQWLSEMRKSPSLHEADKEALNLILCGSFVLAKRSYVLRV